MLVCQVRFDDSIEELAVFVVQEEIQLMASIFRVLLLLLFRRHCWPIHQEAKLDQMFVLRQRSEQRINFAQTIVRLKFR